MQFDLWNDTVFSLSQNCPGVTCAKLSPKITFSPLTPLITNILPQCEYSVSKINTFTEQYAHIYTLEH